MEESHSPEVLARAWERFQKYLDKNGPIAPGMSTPCWLWTGARKGKGRQSYGVFRVGGRKDGRLWRAPRFAWRMTKGPIPPRLFVCHHCDTPACAREDHFFLGTTRENMVDASRKGRTCRGERRPNAKLSDEVVLQMRRWRNVEGWTFDAIAKRVGLSLMAAWNAVTGRNWKHIPMAANDSGPDVIQ